jgi:hypothetical protein
VFKNSNGFRMLTKAVDGGEIRFLDLNENIKEYVEQNLRM